MISQTDLLEKSRNAGPYYAPTPFWEQGSSEILADLTNDGIENFRNRGAPLSFFVPTYGYPGNSLSSEQIAALRDVADSFAPKQSAMVEAWLSGSSHALSDYRAFASAARAGRGQRLLQFSESTVGNPIEHFEFDGKTYSRSALNYLMGLCFLAEHTELDEIGTVLEIGGGFGTLGEILIKCWPKDHVRYINVDIPPTSLFADHYLQNALPDVSLARSVQTADAEVLSISDMAAVSVLPNWQIEALEGKIDLFVNFISFQEMEPPVVQNYLRHVARLRPQWILLRNMREGKQKRTKPGSVGVDEPILIADYDAMLPDYRKVASETSVFGYRTSDGFHSDLVLYRRSE